MVEAAGVFSGRAGSRAPSSPRHRVNNTTSLPRAALCTQGSAASCSWPGSAATAPAPGTRGGSFTRRHEPAAGGGGRRMAPIEHPAGAGWGVAVAARGPQAASPGGCGAGADLSLPPSIPTGNPSCSHPCCADVLSFPPTGSPRPQDGPGGDGCCGGLQTSLPPAPEGCPHAAKARVPGSQPGTSGISVMPAAGAALCSDFLCI